MICPVPHRLLGNYFLSAYMVAWVSDANIVNLIKFTNFF